MNALMLTLLLAAAPEARNVVIVTLDGLRPAEVFHGGDRALMRGVENEEGLVAKYWRDEPDARRRALLPFLWGTVGRDGQLFGNAARGSPMQVANTRRCSYPGYGELFAGYADPRITGNGFGPNPNVTVLEWLNRQPGLEGRVQVFATWDTFFRIFAVERSGLDVRAGWEPPFAREPERTPTRDALDALFRTTTPLFGGNALDAITFAALKESLRTTHPRVLFLGLGETDEWMHAGRYDLALEAAHRADALIAELWATLQSMDEYRGTTTLLVTTDHGRGVGPDDWRHHGADVPGSEQVWLAALGPGVPALGERTETGALTLAQVAATLARLVGHDWNAATPRAAPPVPLEPRLAWSSQAPR
ncbi:MAG: AP protein [Myxococcota bacterium]